MRVGYEVYDSCDNAAVTSRVSSRIAANDKVIGVASVDHGGLVKISARQTTAFDIPTFTYIYNDAHLMRTEDFPTMFSLIETEENEAMIIAEFLEKMNYTFMDIWHHRLSAEMSEYLRKNYLQDKAKGCGRKEEMDSSVSDISDIIDQAVKSSGKRLSQVQLIFENTVRKSKDILRHLAGKDTEKNIHVMGISNGRKKNLDFYSSILKENNRTKDTIILPLPLLLNTELPTLNEKLATNWTKEDEEIDALYKDAQKRKCEGRCPLTSWSAYVVAGVKIILTALHEDIKKKFDRGESTTPACIRDFRRALYNSIIDEEREVELKLDEGVEEIHTYFNQKTINLGYKIGVYKSGSESFEILGNSYNDHIDVLNGTLLKSISHYETQCSAPCSPGYSRVFGEHVSGLHCCWDCVKCAPNYYSTTINAKNCTACLMKQRSTENRTACYYVEYVFKEIGSTISIIWAILVVVAILMVCFTAILVWRNESRPLIKASDPGYLYTILFSLALGFGVSLVPLLKPSQASCGAEFILCSIFTTLATCNLAWKCGKIYSIFAAANSFKRPRFEKVMKRAGQTWMNIGSLGFIFIVQVINSFVPESAWVYDEVQPVDHGSIYLQCDSGHSASSKVMIVLSLILPLIYFVTALLLAFKMRHFPHNFKETLNIFSATLIGLFCCTMFLSGYNLASPEVKPILRAIVLYVISAAFLLCLFLPRVIIIFNDTDTEEERNKMKAQVLAFSLGSTKSSRPGKSSMRGNGAAGGEGS